jgi:hypothetical protein
MKPLLDPLSPTYCRRMARAINKQRYGLPMYIHLVTEPDKRRVIRAKTTRVGALLVGTMGSDMWFPAHPYEIEGVIVSRVP